MRLADLALGTGALQRLRVKRSLLAAPAHWPGPA
jgi:hypothetical protein